MSEMPTLFVANWKMNQQHSKAVAAAEQACSLAAEVAADNKQIIVCPSYPSLFDVTTITGESTVAVGAQDCSEHAEGAYTGQVSAAMIADAGCSYCIVGHSERRHGLHESNETVAQKTTHAAENMLAPIICIGETKEERENGATFAILEGQLTPIIKALSKNSIGVQDACIAYEPVWSIGTGILPDNESLTAVFAWLHDYLKKTKVLANATLLYGGSVTPENSASLLGLSNIGGLLIGGASVDFQSFRKIVLS